METATRGAYKDFDKSYDLLRNGIEQLLAWADRLVGIGTLRELVWSSYRDGVYIDIGCYEGDLQELLDLKEAVGAVASEDSQVLEIKKSVELKIAQCQEELPKYLALLKQAEDKSYAERNKIKEPFEKLTKSLEADLKALFEACDASLGVAVARQVLGVEKVKYTSDYDESGFKTALEKEVLKALEQNFKTLGLALAPQSALNMLKSQLQETIAQIPTALKEIDEVHQELVKEGIVTNKDINALYDPLEQGLEPLKASLQAFVANNGDENIVKMGKEALNCVSHVSDLEKSLPIIENMLEASGANSPQSTAMDLAQVQAFITERLNAELKRNNICEHLGNFERELETLQERAQELQAAINQDKEESMTSYINAFQQAHQNTKELRKSVLKVVEALKSKISQRRGGILKKAVRLGSIRALTQLGLSYMDGGIEKIKKKDAKTAADYLKKVFNLGDGMAEVGLERLHYFGEINWDNNRVHLIDLVRDVEATLLSKEVEGERAYLSNFYEDAHISPTWGADPDYRMGSIYPFFYKGENDLKTPLVDEGFCATMQGHNAHLELSRLKTIKEVYGKSTKDDYDDAYGNAEVAYLKGIALGSGVCTLELAHLELEEPKHYRMSAQKKQNAILEANHRAIGYFKQALERGYTSALSSLGKSLEEQQELLAKAPKHSLHSFLSKYASDFKEVEGLMPAFIDKFVAFGGKLDAKAHFTPTFWQHPDLKNLEVKAKEKPKSTTKPLWKYGKDTKQAFKDYMEALKRQAMLRRGF
ncbi:hypothetical protein [Helicobacter felistomachi]|uniref:hypothetical protein n=1 Tax=Helicobacter felistomachi TaxID=3040201 RepID=UPI002572B49C|nr:hypothetical protein [Helicobacter sp. NHP21005]